MAPTWKATPPRDDSVYFDRMSKAIFTAGLNWKMVENKWPAFQKAFSGFSPAKVAKLTEKDVTALMKNKRIVRNEKKIRATIENAKAILAIEKEFGSVNEYIASIAGGEAILQRELQEKFRHVGPSTARMFLWMVNYPLTATKEERIWMKQHPEHH
jgi:3-methyladenine DNA glycosylase Tag